MGSLRPRMVLSNLAKRTRNKLLCSVIDSLSICDPIILRDQQGEFYEISFGYRGVFVLG